MIFNVILLDAVTHKILGWRRAPSAQIYLSLQYAKENLGYGFFKAQSICCIKEKL